VGLVAGTLVGLVAGLAIDLKPHTMLPFAPAAVGLLPATGLEPGFSGGRKASSLQP